MHQQKQNAPAAGGVLGGQELPGLKNKLKTAVNVGLSDTYPLWC